MSCLDAGRLIASGLGQMNGIAVGINPRGPQPSQGTSTLVDETLIQISHVWMTGAQDGDEWRYYRGTVSSFVNVPRVRPRPQNSCAAEDIQPRNLLAHIFHLLDDNRCSTFISNMINVARQLTGRTPYTYDGKELAVAVARQEKGGFRFMSGANGDGGAGSAYGDIFSGEATAQIVMFNTAYGPRHPVGVQVSYALTALHEILHLAGGGASAYDGSRAYYMDVVLAQAAKIITGAPGYPAGYDPQMPSSNIMAEMTRAAGVYWGRQLREHCMPQEYR